MSFLSWFTKEKALIEADIQKLIVNIKKDILIAEADLQKGLNWLAAETPLIVQGLAAVAAFAEELAPLAGPAAPEVAVVGAALGAAQQIVGGLQSFAQKYANQSGLTPDQLKQLITDGYALYSNAKAAVHTVAAVATKPAPATP